MVGLLQLLLLLLATPTTTLLLYCPPTLLLLLFHSSSTTTLLYSTLLLSSPKQLLLFLLLLLLLLLPYYYCLLLLLLSSINYLYFCQLLILLPYYYCLLLLIVRSAYQVRKILSIWCSCVIEQSQYGSCCFFWEAAPAFLSNLPSPLFLPPFLSSMFGKQQLLFLHLFLSMFAKQLLLFLPNLPSPPRSSVLSMMKLSKSIHYMEYELMIKNLWGT